MKVVCELTQTAGLAERQVLPFIPETDAEPGAVEAMLAANAYFRINPWPAPFDATTHRIHQGDARDLSWIASKSVHLVVTSPPYWTLKKYDTSEGQMGEIEDYETFLDELDKVWAECERVLVEGGRICCVVGDVCVPRKVAKKHYVVPLHADIGVRARRLGLDYLTPILWFKIANGSREVEGNGAGFYGKPYQPGSVVKNDFEYILMLRKSGKYRSTTMLQKALSMITKKEMQKWLRTAWTDIQGESTRNGHPAPFPESLAERLIRMFSFVGDKVLDPFAGTGSTACAAVSAGRHSISNELEPAYLEIARKRISNTVAQAKTAGPELAMLVVD